MRITSGRAGAAAAEQADADESTAELAASYWRAYDERMASTSFLAMAREFPHIVAQAMRLGNDASRRDLMATIALNLISGVFTGFALLATTGVLEALFAAVPPRSVSAPRSRRWSWSRRQQRRARACRRRRAGPRRGCSRRSTAPSRSGCSI